MPGMTCTVSRFLVLLTRPDLNGEKLDSATIATDEVLSMGS